MDIKEILLGIAIGDAFGAGVEFQDRRWIHEHVDFSRFVNARHAIPVAPEKGRMFTENYRVWDYTDDTEMTLGLMRALMDDRPFAEALLIEHWEREYRDGEARKGHGRNGHGSMAWYFSGAMSLEEMRNFQRQRPNPGNAPVMRAVPLGLLSTSKVWSHAAINANATHPNPVAVQASQLVAWAAHLVLRKSVAPKNILSTCLSELSLNLGFRDHLFALDTLPPFEVLSEQDFEVLCGPQPIRPPYFLPGICGLPSDAKLTAGAVLYILKWSRDAFDALKKSVLLGGDVDSVASVTTGIMAGLKGLESLPDWMLMEVEGRDYLEAVAGKFASSLAEVG